MPPPSAQTSLDQAGAITKALMVALDQIETFAAASQVGADGKPSGSAVYMHMAMGYPVDPKMYANAWTPGGGDSSSSFSDDGTFTATPTTTTPATGAASTAPPPGVPAGSVYPPPQPKPDQQMEASIQAAMFTSFLVDNMLEVTDKGIAAAWPERRVSIEYFTIIEGMQPVNPNQPSQDVLNKVKAAQALLYVQNDKGDFIGYTPKYAQYRKNRTAWTDAVAAQAVAYARAMADPVEGAAYPVTAATYANKVTQALDDLNAMGRREVEDAINVIATVGENAITALAAMAREMWGAYNIQLGGTVSSNVPWSYINPISWWDHTNDSFGVQKITADDRMFAASSASGSSSYARNWYNNSQSSASGSAGINVGFAGGDVSVSHSQSHSAFDNQGDQNSWSHYADKSSSASIEFEYFLATIERPWLLGDLLNMEGWYMVGQKKNSISDGQIITQVGDKAKLLPMIPKAFVIIRNVKITADDWGDAGSAFSTASQHADGTASTSSTSVSASVHYLFAHASGSYSGSRNDGAFDTSTSDDSGMTFTSDGHGGTLEIKGSQIVGWIGEIQPPAPRMDDPNPATTTGATGASTVAGGLGGDATTTTQPAPTPVPA